MTRFLHACLRLIRGDRKAGRPATPPPSDPDLSATELFTLAFCQRLADVDARIHVEPRQPLQVIATLGEAQQVVSLKNAYRQYCAMPDQLAEVLTGVVSTLLETLSAPSSRAAAEPIDRLIPVVKSVDYIEDTRQAIIETGSDVSQFDLYSERLNDELVILYAINNESSIRFLNRSAISEFDLSPYVLREKAVENLLEILPPLTTQTGGNLYLLIAGGIHESSLILVDSIWTTENFPVEGEFVIGIPARNMVMVTGTGHPADMALLREMVANLVGEVDYPMSSQLFVRRDGEWLILKE